MANKRNLRRVHLQSGATDRMGRPLEGIFEVLIDEDDIVNQMERAFKNKSKMATDGPIVVTYLRASKAEADFLINGLAFGKPVKGAGVAKDEDCRP